MNEIDKTNLTNETKYRLNKISRIENYVNQETNQIQTCSKNLSKYIAAFDYMDKNLIFLSAASDGVCIFFVLVLLEHHLK